MQPRVLLIQPPIYDFSAHDFWLKPYGLLRVAGQLRGQASMQLFDYLDREPLSPAQRRGLRVDPWGRGQFPSQIIDKPACFKSIPRHYRRFGRPRSELQQRLAEEPAFDFVLIQTVMTYWYLGVKEVIEDVRRWQPQAKIVLGGVYATLCPEQARRLGADLVVWGSQLEPLWSLMKTKPLVNALPYWEGYARLSVGILKLAQGCPFRCTYCSVPQVEPDFKLNDQSQALEELSELHARGVRNVAFYDDALLYKADHMLLPFLDAVRRRPWVGQVHFHTPNALNARFINQEVAVAMVQSGFRTFHLGFESSAYEWQKKTGGKVYAHEFARAVQHLVAAGAERQNIVAYLIAGHPAGDQNLEASMHAVHDLGVRVMLSEFSPIPGTPDGEACRSFLDLDEPLWHNKTVCPMLLLGHEEVQRLKQLQHHLNQSLKGPALVPV